VTNVIASIQRANIGSHFRAFGLRGMSALIDPFINVDHAWMSAPTFPPHPHAGFSAISYVFLDSETGIDNRDSIGTHNLIRPGGLHWITAGSGIVHKEDPAETGRTVHSLQIFVGLARNQQQVAPFPLSLEPQDVPVAELPGAKVRVPLGRFGAVQSPLSPPTDVTMLDISLNGDAECVVPVAVNETTFVMPIFGVIEVNGTRFDREDLKLPIFKPRTTRQDIILKTSRDGAKVMVFGGKPLNHA